MNYNQSIVKNLLKLLSELKLVHSANRLFHIFIDVVVVKCAKTSLQCIPM